MHCIPELKQIQWNTHARYIIPLIQVALWNHLSNHKLMTTSDNIKMSKQNTLAMYLYAGRMHLSQNGCRSAIKIIAMLIATAQRIPPLLSYTWITYITNTAHNTDNP